MIRQDRNARIIVGGDINGQMKNLHTKLTKCGFHAGLETGTGTHRDGNMLDQVWIRNLDLKSVLLSDFQDTEVTDHCCIKVTVNIPAVAPQIEEDGQGPE
jgi:hypothetical protein